MAVMLRLLVEIGCHRQAARWRIGLAKTGAWSVQPIEPVKELKSVSSPRP